MKSLSLLTLIALGGTALAQDAEMTAPGSAEASFAAMDTDANQVVTEDEFVAYTGAGTEAQFEVIAGDDAEMTQDELMAFLGVLPEGEAMPNG